MNYKEKLKKRIKEVRGQVVGYRVDRVTLPNGKYSTREYLDHPGAVGVIPITKNNKILLVKQFRYAINKTTWEIPAGKLHKGENILSCIKRELEEETGYKAKKFKKLVSFWPTPAFANEIIYLYVASDLKKGKANPDDDEFLSCREWSLKEIHKAIKNGAIKDSKTIVAILSFETFMKSKF